jgi:predicted RNA-binding Zn-ribbon protein involved in translation (DUF1610 family)
VDYNLCTECEQEMEVLTSYKNDNLLRCPNCGLEMYEHDLRKEWERREAEVRRDFRGDLAPTKEKMMGKYKLGDWLERRPEDMTNEDRERRMEIEFGPVIHIEAGKRIGYISILCSDGTQLTTDEGGFQKTRRRHSRKLTYLTFTK